MVFTRLPLTITAGRGPAAPCARAALSMPQVQKVTPPAATALARNFRREVMDASLVGFLLQRVGCRYARGKSRGKCRRRGTRRKSWKCDCRPALHPPASWSNLDRVLRTALAAGGFAAAQQIVEARRVWPLTRLGQAALRGHPVHHLRQHLAEFLHQAAAIRPGLPGDLLHFLRV